MLISFSKVRWANFLSTGNEFTEIDLQRSKSTLIIGPNGSGKSTFLDALMFGLYGKAYRNINKPQLVNSITGKGMLVEVEFNIAKKEYLVRRGTLPDIFEIFVNGELLKQDAKTRDYQKQFVKGVLKMSDKSFKQIVVLGSANYVPFMQLETYKRREIIEDLLDIQVFSTMNVILKDKMNSNKVLLTEADTQIRINENKIELGKKHLESLKANHDEIIRNKRYKLDEASALIECCLIGNRGLVEQQTNLSDKIRDRNSVDDKINKLSDMDKQLNDKTRKLKRDIQFFHDNDDCPTCKQGIAHDFKTETITLRTEKLKSIEDGLTKVSSQYNAQVKRLDEISMILAEISKLHDSIQGNNQEILFQNQNIKALNDEIKDLEKTSKKISADQGDMKDHIKDLNQNKKDKENLVKQQNIMEISSVLLKDTGIKTKIIKQYVPIINKLVNKYLTSMGFFSDFTIDENFNEVIKSRHRDEFSYASFSEGEKARIDLALLFCWRAVARLRNSAGSNILIMDEVFDSSMDTQGGEELLRILDDVSADTNVFVISHKDALFDKFHSVISFEKVKNFSRIAK